MDALLTREAVVALAVLGALASTAASILQASKRIGAGRASQLNWLGYAFMGVSMALFIVAGFRS
jgi:hypothetical protein